MMDDEDEREYDAGHGYADEDDEGDYYDVEIVYAYDYMTWDQCDIGPPDVRGRDVDRDMVFPSAVPDHLAPLFATRPTLEQRDIFERLCSVGPCQN